MPPHSLPRRHTPERFSKYSIMRRVSSSSAGAPVQRNNAPIAFISGPLEVDYAYFQTHYAASIKDAIEKGHRFIIGPSTGIDTFALEHLRKSSVPASRIQIFLNTSEETRLRPIFKQFEEMGGSMMFIKGGRTERDEAMTLASHYDILRYRTDEECRALYKELYRKRVSGTEKNELRRKSGIGLTLA